VVSADLLVEPAFRTGPAFTRTLGPEVADLSELAGFPPDPEQRLALDAIFAMRGGTDLVAAFEAAVIAPRQNMKTGLFKMCALGWLFITDQRLIIWSAHEFPTSKEAHRDLVELVEGCDPLRKRIKTIHRTNGDEGIELVTGQRINFRARTKTGGRGLSGDKIVLDEAFALQDSHLGSLIPLLSARADPQVVYGSSAGLATSEVLRGVRDRGRAGTDPSLAYIEWCDDVPGGCETDRCTHALEVPGCRMDDQARWGRANSQMGRRMTVAYLEQERRMLTPAEFGRERLGWWDESEDVASALDFDTWLALADPNAERGTELVFGVSTAPDRAWTAIAVGWKRPDGATQVMLAAYHAGAAWVPARIVELGARWGGKVLADTAARGLVPDATELSVDDQAQAHNALADALEARTIRHDNEPALNVAVRAARWRPQGNTRVLDRKGSADISPITAAAMCVQALVDGGASVYEDRGLLVLG